MDISLETDPPVVAWLSARDFAAARQLRGFSIWASRREFIEERDALFVGLSFAGVQARRQAVSFEAFQSWVRLTGAPADSVGLDEFAAHLRFRRLHPAAGVVGRLREAGLAGPGLGGAQSVPIRADLFEGWRREFTRLGLFAAPRLDDYATQAISCCMAPRDRRPAARAA